MEEWKDWRMRQDGLEAQEGSRSVFSWGGTAPHQEDPSPILAEGRCLFLAPSLQAHPPPPTPTSAEGERRSHPPAVTAF